MLLLRLEMVLLLLLGLLMLLLLCEDRMVPSDAQRLLLWLLLQLHGVRPRRVQRVDVVPIFRGQRSLSY